MSAAHTLTFKRFQLPRMQTAFYGGELEGPDVPAETLLFAEDLESLYDALHAHLDQACAPTAPDAPVPLTQ